MEKRFVVVIDRSVYLSPYLKDIKPIIEEMARKFCADDASTISGPSAVKYNLNIVVPAITDIVPHATRSTNLDSFLFFLSNINFNADTHRGNSGITDGLSVALKKFQSLHTQQWQSHLQQCVLVTASRVCPDYEKLVNLFKKSYVSLSVICPRDTPMSRGIHDTAKHIEGSFIMALNQPSILVFICGQFQEAREAIEQLEAETNNGNKSEQDVLVSLENHMFHENELRNVVDNRPIIADNEINNVVAKSLVLEPIFPKCDMPVIADNELSAAVTDFLRPLEPTLPKTTQEPHDVDINMQVVAGNEISDIHNGSPLPMEPTFPETTQELRIVDDNMPLIADSSLSNYVPTWSDYNNGLITLEDIDVAAESSTLEPISQISNGTNLSTRQGGLQNDQNGTILIHHPEEIAEFNTLISHGLWPLEVATYPNFSKRSFNINFKAQQMMANLLVTQQGTATASAYLPSQLNTFHLSTSWLEKNKPKEMRNGASRSKVLSHNMDICSSSNGSSSNVFPNHNYYTNLSLEAPSGYIQAWEGSITSRISGTTISVSKLVAYRKPEISEKIFEKWPKMMHLSHLVPLTDTCISPNQANKYYLIFNVTNSWPTWVAIRSNKLCAYVDLPGQTLVLWASADKTCLMGMLCEAVIPIPID